jgi:hypothetical protein
MRTEVTMNNIFYKNPSYLVLLCTAFFSCGTQPASQVAVYKSEGSETDSPASENQADAQGTKTQVKAPSTKNAAASPGSKGESSENSPNNNEPEKPSTQPPVAMQPPAMQPPAMQPPAMQPPAMQPPAMQPPASAPKFYAVSYDVEVKTFAEKSCTGCHTGSAARAGIDLSAHEDPAKKKTLEQRWGVSLAEVSSSSMPKGTALPAAEKTEIVGKLTMWKSLGYPKTKAEADAKVAMLNK